MAPESNDEKFLKHLNKSIEGVQTVGGWLALNGISTQLNGMYRAPDHSQWKKYADECDMRFMIPAEVKHSGKDFTCREDWPFPDFIVCAKHSWENSLDKPLVYITLNKAKTHVGIVRTVNHPNWFVKRIRDQRYNGVQQYQLCYMSVLDEVTFTPMEIMEAGALRSILLAPARGSNDAA